ncbi:MAG: hypothetical protein V8R80_02060 [Eubacterium sp.]
MQEVSSEQIWIDSACVPAQLLYEPVLPDSDSIHQANRAAPGGLEKMVLDVYNHIILEKEDASKAVNNAMNF